MLAAHLQHRHNSGAACSACEIVALRAEIVRLKDEQFERDMKLSDDWAKIQKGIEEQAEAAVAKVEARLLALIQALETLERLNAHFGSGPHCTCSQYLRGEIICKALADDVRAAK